MTEQASRVTQVAEILVDESHFGRPLSYLVPDELELHVGDAVHVPYGKREANGVVLGKAVGEDAKKATRNVTRVWGKRTTYKEMELAKWVAERYYVDLAQVVVRLAPRHKRGVDRMESGEVLLSDKVSTYSFSVERDTGRRYLLRQPLVDPAVLAAQEAVRISKDGQVLVLCPTKELVGRVVKCFESGAARLDVNPKTGDLSPWKGFAEGTVQIGVGTRNAALWSPKALGGIVVVEDSHPGHQEVSLPYTHARDLAAERTRREDAALVVIGGTPTAVGLGGGVRMAVVGTEKDWPGMQLFDRTELAPGERDLPEPLVQALSREVKVGQRPVVVAESRPPRRVCTKCGRTVVCPTCGSTSCEHPSHEPCEHCFGLGVRLSGWDVDRLSRALTGRIGDNVDYVTMADLKRGKDARLVVVFDVDPALRSGGFTPESVPTRLVLGAAEAAGVGGRVLAATSRPSDPLLTELFSRDLLAISKRVWATAKASGLPPFGRLVRMQITGETPPKVAGWPGVVHGPRRKGEDWEVVVRCRDDKEAARLSVFIQRVRRGRKVRVTLS